MNTKFRRFLFGTYSACNAYSCSEKIFIVPNSLEFLLCDMILLASWGLGRQKLNSWSSMAGDSFVSWIKEFQSWEYVCFPDQGQALQVLGSKILQRLWLWALLLPASIYWALKEYRNKLNTFYWVEFTPSSWELRKGVNNIFLLYYVGCLLWTTS